MPIIGQHMVIGMAKDPVYGKEVTPEPAYGKGEFHGRMYYFDSPKFEKQFLCDPGAFAERWATSSNAGRTTEFAQYIDPQGGHRDIPEVTEIMRYDSFGRRIK